MKFMGIIENWRKTKKAPKGFFKDGTPKEGFVTRHFNRYISSFISACLLNTKITPNQINFLTFLLSFACFPIFLYGRFIIGGLFIQLLSILDGVDGELARVRKTTSKLGEIVDSLVDRGIELIIGLGIAFAIWNATNSIFPWIAFTIGMVGFFLNNYVWELIGHRISAPKTLEKIDSLTVRALKFRWARDVQLAIVAISSILGRPELGLMSVGIICIIHFFVRFSLAFPLIKK